MFTDKMMMSPWDRWYSTSCCLCCHVRTGTIILGVWYMLINAVVLLILLTALSDPEKYHLTSAELANDLDVMDDAKANRWRARLQAEQPSCFDRAK
ncbi:lysosomal-associated transmembrane protein 4B-like [Xiphophorus hellerii]|nr:lysosomal-associated transmembrane protein 4B-like [Xiphophorus hellerii]